MQSLRAKITAANRTPAPKCFPPLIAKATLTDSMTESVRALAEKVVLALRRKKQEGSSGVEDLIREYSLSSQEGVALMCLAKALLRVPDSVTRDALIRDKISTAAWQAHIGNSPSTLVNAATWGLIVLACQHDIALNIDADEAERLDLSLSLLEARFRAPLTGWNGRMRLCAFHL